MEGIMMRRVRQFGVIASTLGLAFVMAMLGGNTSPMCGTSDPATTACLTAADCEGESGGDCAGEWACVEAACTWQCTIEQVGCYSDADCGKGTHCSVSDGICNAPPDCPMCDVCFGSCVADVVVEACLTDSECPDGQVCDTSVCLPPPGCTGDMACPAVCYGQCTDKAATCQSDAECAADQYCDFSTCYATGEARDPMPCTPDSSGAGCVVPPCDGVCTTRPVVTGCTSDADCGAGQVCQFVDHCYASDCADGSSDCGAPMPCQTEGVCVDAPTGCWADDECPAGFQCIFYNDCPVYADGVPREDVPCASKGVCEPIPQPECFTDADCGEGFYCQALYKCDPSTNCDAAGNCGDEKCLGSGGVCVPQTVGCTSDADCPADMICEYFPCDCGTYGSAGEAPSDCYCEPSGQCVPRQTSPCDAVKCAAGTHCEERTECYDGCTSPDGSNLCDPATGVAPCNTWAECVPDQKGCGSDAECPAGYACQLYPCDCANPDPNTGDCLCEPWGECVPVTQPTCTTDADCGPGFHCEIDSWCGCPEGMDCTTEYDAWCIDGGVCVADPEPLCLTNSDCPEGEICNALDVCIVLPCDSIECSYCHGYCVAQQTTCASDYDCPAGQVCQMPPYMDPTTGAMACCPANSDVPCLMIYPSCEGVCVPAATEICGNWIDDDGDGLVDEGCSTTGCSSDSDCQWYETCQMWDYATGDAAIACCPAGAPCIPELPPCGGQGVCVLMDGYCWSNADCAVGEVCEGASTCPPGAYCLVAAGPGKCSPGGQSEFCGNGMDDDGDGLVDEGCDNACPDGTMCAAGEVCEEQTVCPDCYNQDPACLMPCKLQYVCVPEKPAACVVSGCSGQICAPEPMASTCEWLPWYACFHLAACEQQADGGCGWTPNAEFKQCMLDNGGY